MACKGIVRAVYGPDRKLIDAELQCEGDCDGKECPKASEKREDTQGGGYTLHYKCECKGTPDGGPGDCGTELIFRFDKQGSRKVEIFCPHACNKHQALPHCRPQLVKTVLELVGDGSLFDLTEPKHNTVEYWRCGCPVLKKEWF
jgi:hypothetical protein